jgi:hypothetical protein
LTIALEQTQKPWDPYLRRAYVPNRADQCLQAARNARRLARNSGYQVVRAHYERVADDYDWLAADISARTAGGKRDLVANELTVIHFASTCSLATHLVLARLKMMLVTIPCAILTGVVLEFIRYFLTGKP